jgi:hypothetical protein
VVHPAYVIFNNILMIIIIIIVMLLLLDQSTQRFFYVNKFLLNIKLHVSAFVPSSGFSIIRTLSYLYVIVS